jgi:hypothetical protein
VLGIRPTTDRAHATLLSHQRVELVSADAVPPLEVIMPAVPVESLDCFAAPSVVARLAVRMPPILRVLVARELVERLDETAVGAALHKLTLANVRSVR